MSPKVVGVPPITHSIPHNYGFRQATLSTNGWKSAKIPFSSATNPTDFTPETPLQEQARLLYQVGLNVFPQPLGQKAGYPWRNLQFTRLHPTHFRYGLPVLFSVECNLAVMCGRTSQNLFVLDCETEDSFELNLYEVQKRKIPLWAVKSARGGHIYLRCVEGEVANVDTGILPQMEVRGCRRYLLAPPSVHPSGVIYEWFTREGDSLPEVNLDCIDWLRDISGNRVALKLDQPQRKPNSTARHLVYSPLSRATRDYISHGHMLTEGTRNNRLFSAACDLAGNQYSYTEASTLLSPIARNSGLSEHETTATLRSAFSKSREPAKPPSARPISQRNNDWENALRYIDNQKWAGRTGATDYKLLLTLIERARANGGETGIFRASIREIAATARLSTTTTQKALKRLLEQKPPLLFEAGHDKMSGAKLWRFSSYIVNQGKVLNNDTLSPPPQWLRNSVSFFDCGDALERGALGVVGLKIYRAMIQYAVPAMPKTIAELVGVRVHQVNYALKKMLSFGVVERVRLGWCAVPMSDAQLDEQVGVAAGVIGKGAARRSKFAQERAIFAGRVILLARLQRDKTGSSGAVRAVPEPSVNLVELSVTCVLESGLQRNAGSQQRESASVKYWRCPNCGQSHFGEQPPDLCDFCHDLTTWQAYDPEQSGESVLLPPEVEAAEDEDDLLLRTAVELGGVIVDMQVVPRYTRGSQAPP